MCKSQVPMSMRGFNFNSFKFSWHRLKTVLFTFGPSQTKANTHLKSKPLESNAFRKWWNKIWPVVDSIRYVSRCRHTNKFSVFDQNLILICFSLLLLTLLILSKIKKNNKSSISRCLSNIFLKCGLKASAIIYWALVGEREKFSGTPPGIITLKNSSFPKHKAT